MRSIEWLEFFRPDVRFSLGTRSLSIHERYRRRALDFRFPPLAGEPSCRYQPRLDRSLSIANQVFRRIAERQVIAGSGLAEPSTVARQQVAALMGLRDGEPPFDCLRF